MSVTVKAGQLVCVSLRPQLLLTRTVRLAYFFMNLEGSGARPVRCMLVRLSRGGTEVDAEGFFRRCATRHFLVPREVCSAVVLRTLLGFWRTRACV